MTVETQAISLEREHIAEGSYTGVAQRAAGVRAGRAASADKHYTARNERIFSNRDRVSQKSSTPLFNYPQSELESDISCNRFGCRLRSFCACDQAFAL
jgi:hypothetical protein